MIFEVGSGGQIRRLDVERKPEGLQVRRVSPAGEAARVRLEPITGSECWRLIVDGTAISVRLCAAGDSVLVTMGAERLAVAVRRALPIPSRRSATVVTGDRFEVRAPMPGLVTATPVGTGQSVEAGSAVAIVEAMKMQMEVPAPAAGRIEEVRVRPGQEVAGGQVLAVIRAAPEVQA